MQASAANRATVSARLTSENTMSMTGVTSVVTVPSAWWVRLTDASFWVVTLVSTAERSCRNG